MNLGKEFKAYRTIAKEIEVSIQPLPPTNWRTRLIAHLIAPILYPA